MIHRIFVLFVSFVIISVLLAFYLGITCNRLVPVYLSNDIMML